MIFCYQLNRFLIVCLLLFTQQNSNFQGEYCPQKMQFLAQTSPADTQCKFLLVVKQMPLWVVSSEVLTTEGFVLPFPILLNPQRHSFINFCWLILKFPDLLNCPLQGKELIFLAWQLFHTLIFWRDPKYRCSFRILSRIKNSQVA